MRGSRVLNYSGKKCNKSKIKEGKAEKVKGRGVLTLATGEVGLIRRMKVDRVITVERNGLLNYSGNRGMCPPK